MNGIIEVIDKANGILNDIVWGWPAIIMILFTGVLLTVRTKCLQVRKFGDALDTTIVSTLREAKKNKGKKSITFV